MNNQLNSSSAVGVTLALLLAVHAPLLAKTKEGDKYLKAGEEYARQGEFDIALAQFDKALQTDAQEPRYIILYQRTKQRCTDQHLESGRRFRNQAKLKEALKEFQKALSSDPSSAIAASEVMATNEMLAKVTASASAQIGTESSSSERVLTAKSPSLGGPPELRPLRARLGSLQLNNQSARNLYIAVTKLCGINVVFDPTGIDLSQGGTHSYNVDFRNTSLSEALAYLTKVTHTFWKPISENAILVIQDTEQKRQEYQDEIVKTFFLRHFVAPNELSDIVSSIKIATKTGNGIFAIPGQNAIVIRGSTSVVALAKKMVEDLDQTKAEVLLDVTIVELSRSKVQNLGAALNGGGISVPVTYGPPSASPSSSAESNANAPLSRIPHLSSHDFQANLPGVLLQALMSDSSTHLLQQPQLRTIDGGKATLKIGSRIPYVSGALSSAVGNASAMPYATTTFQQIDVGVNIDLLVHVSAPSEVGMHIRVELSNVSSTETIAGVQQPIIGQKVNEADISLTDGETSILGGLTSDSEMRSTAGIPGLVNIPILRYLGGSQSRDREQSNIIIAITPHILRNAGRSRSADDEVLAGTAQHGDVRQQAPDIAEQSQRPIVDSPKEAGTDMLPPTGNSNINQVKPAVVLKTAQQQVSIRHLVESKTNN